jgi:hypothetical protein
MIIKKLGEGDTSGNNVYSRAQEKGVSPRVIVKMKKKAKVDEFHPLN